LTKHPNPTIATEDAFIRVFALIAAGFLLNIGLFFVLGILTSLFVGLIIGYVIGERWKSTLAGGICALISYSIIFPVTNLESDIIIILEAIGIMVLLGFFGGYFGGYIRKKTVKSLD